MPTRSIAKPAVVVLSALLTTSCSSSIPDVTEPADAIFVGGTIVTVAEDQPTAEALAIQNGKILAVGDAADLLSRHRGDETEIRDLRGKTVVPGFLDAHSHFINALSVARQASVYAPPFGPGDSIDAIVQALKELEARIELADDEPLTAYGYDGDRMQGGRELTAADLDPHFPDRPVVVQHVSLHGAVLNSRALAQYGFTADTVTPPGGIIARKPGGNEPAGLVMETAYIEVFSKLPRPGPAQMVERLADGQQLYAAAGITTAHEGATHLLDLAILEKGAREGRLELDIVAFPFFTDFQQILRTHAPADFGTYRNRLKLAGVKVTLDGSPQGRTAFFSTPYLQGGPGGETDWRGEPTMPAEDALQIFRRVHDLGLPLIVHCNGDAAIDMFLDCFEQAWGEDVTADHRTGVIHSQFVRPDQLERYAAWNIVPSFYTEHTYFFGSTHIANRGLEQASFLSPMRTALDMGLHCGNHTDFNVAPIDQLFVMWSAVNRVTREGEVLGADQRITPLEALKAITLDVAWWYREEDRKGSIEPGKLADLVILDSNPLTVDPMAIKDIRVLETIKEGRTIYRRER